MALVNSATGSFGDDIEFGFTATLNNALLLVLMTRNTGATTVTPPSGWTTLAYNRDYNPVGFQDAIVVYGKTSAGTEDHVTTSSGLWPKSDGGEWFVIEWNGISITDLVTAKRVGSGATMLGNLVSAEASGVVFGLFAQSQDTTKSFTEGSGWTLVLEETDSTHPACIIVYQDAVDGNDYTPTVTSNRTNGWKSITLFFGEDEDPEEPPGEVEGSPEPGIWMDWDLDGFDDGTGLSTDDARLVRMLPQSVTVGPGLSDNVTEWVLGSQHDITGNRPGSANHIDQPQPETYTFFLKNTDGRFSPDNTLSPLYGKVKPGVPVWGGMNADGTLSGTGQTVYGFMAGYVREFVPVPVAGATHAPWVEVLVDGPMAHWRRRRARVEFAEGRSYADYRGAILDSIGEPARRDLGYEADELAFSGNAASKRGRIAPVSGSRDSFVPTTIPDFRLPETRTDPVALLEALNLATGARHFIQPADSKEIWFEYTTVPRTHNLTADSAATWSGVDIVDVSGYRISDESILNVQEITFSQVSSTITPVTVWEYGDVPFSLTSTANKSIVADLGDFVLDAVLDVASTGSAVTSTMQNYGTGAVITLGSGGSSQITALKIRGRRIARDAAQVIERSAPGVTPATERLASSINTDYLQSQGLAEGRAEFTPWKFSRSLSRPSARFVRDFSTVLPRRLYDVVDLTVAQLSVTTKRHEITSIDFRATVAASAEISDWSFNFGLQETPNDAALDLFTLDVSLLSSSDQLAP